MAEWTKGLVTFADILGWKGIWSKKDQKAIIDLIEIKENLEIKISELKEKFLFKSIEETFKITVPDKQRVTINKLQSKDIIREVFEILVKPMGIENDVFRRFIADTEINLSVELISDTFVISSNSNNLEKELSLHGLILKELIEKCILHSLLLRGATSYGRYIKEQSVFLGPAIDEAAEWHELGEEVSIFLTPSALLNCQNVVTDLNLFIKRTPNLKHSNFETYCVKWKDNDDLFLQLSKSESPLLPEFSRKYMNTLKYLKETYPRVH